MRQRMRRIEMKCDNEIPVLRRHIVEVARRIRSIHPGDIDRGSRIIFTDPFHALPGDLPPAEFRALLDTQFVVEIISGNCLRISCRDSGKTVPHLHKRCSLLFRGRESRVPADLENKIVRINQKSDLMFGTEFHCLFKFPVGFLRVLGRTNVEPLPLRSVFCVAEQPFRVHRCIDSEQRLHFLLRRTENHLFTFHIAVHAVFCVEGTSLCIRDIHVSERKQRRKRGDPACNCLPCVAPFPVTVFPGNCAVPNCFGDSDRIVQRGFREELRKTGRLPGMTRKRKTYNADMGFLFQFQDELSVLQCRGKGTFAEDQNQTPRIVLRGKHNPRTSRKERRERVDFPGNSGVSRVLIVHQNAGDRFRAAGHVDQGGPPETHLLIDIADAARRSAEVGKLQCIRIFHVDNRGQHAEGDSLPGKIPFRIHPGALNGDVFHRTSVADLLKCAIADPFNPRMFRNRKAETILKQHAERIRFNEGTAVRMLEITILRKRFDPSVGIAGCDREWRELFHLSFQIRNHCPDPLPVAAVELSIGFIQSVPECRRG